MILQEIRRYYNCRCYAEPAFKDPPIEPVYPELILIPATRVIKLIKNGIKKIKKASRRVRKPRRISIDDLNNLELKNLKRFNKKLPKSAKETEILRLPNGNTIFKADVPARNIPNSKATYEKVINSNGKTIGYTKTTYGPNGKIIHIKDKMRIVNE